MKTMLPMIKDKQQIYIHEPCLITAAASAASAASELDNPCCGQEGPWLRVYVEKEKE